MISRDIDVFNKTNVATCEEIRTQYLKYFFENVQGNITRIKKGNINREHSLFTICADAIECYFSMVLAKKVAADIPRHIGKQIQTAFDGLMKERVLQKKRILTLQIYAIIFNAVSEKVDNISTILNREVSQDRATAYATFQYEANRMCTPTARITATDLETFANALLRLIYYSTNGVPGIGSLFQDIDEIEEIYSDNFMILRRDPKYN